MNEQQTNFGFLQQHAPLLHTLATQAERYFAEDPNTCLLKLRQFGEKLAVLLAAKTNTPLPPNPRQVDVLRALQDHGVIGRDLADRFHAIRKAGNRAVHDFTGAHNEALNLLQFSHELSIIYHRFTKDINFKASPFIPPPDPKKKAQAVEDQLKKLTATLEAVLREKAELQALAQSEAEKRARAEAEALIAREAHQAVPSESQLAAETKSFEATVEAERQKAAATPLQQLEELKAHTVKLTLELDEDATRALIDQQLREAGWEVDSATLRYAHGARPQKGKNLAIAEWPTGTGPADYVLFIGLTPVAVVEAKRAKKNVKSALAQAERYSESIKQIEDLHSPGGPWGKYRIPFLFSTNGRDYHKQIQELSGIWSLDVRRDSNSAKALPGWYTPDGLQALLKKDIDQANADLQADSLDFLGLRPYQNEAIKAVEQRLIEGSQSVLLAMATGTGKTRTALGLLYRLLKARRFNRILFLVDRTALGEQAHNAFKDVKMEHLQTFADIYEVKGLGDLGVEVTTKVHLATVQAMVKRCLYSEEPATVDQYDCIIVDECHRGYNLDREMTDAELTFRDEDDYISKYSRVLEHFDAVKIGLTATPALHTTQVFGEPAFNYSYRQAVIDGYLVDHEPPLQLVTALAEDGITWQAGAAIPVYSVRNNTTDLFHTPDEVNVNIDSFNTRVLTESFNRVITQELAPYLDPEKPGKTLIFCATDVHADMVVRLLKEALDDTWGPVSQQLIRKITGAADRPSELIRRYKNEELPKIAVTVDLLTTGIDVPQIVNLVFLRRVKSRILYDQMMGRATRLCPDINKTVFHIFDAVQLYDDMQDYTDMKPVVTQPKITYGQLAAELAQVPDVKAKYEFLAQLIVKLQRKRLSETDAEEYKALTQMTVKETVEFLRDCSPAQAAEWLAAHPRVPEFLDSSVGDGKKFFISDHTDELRRVERGYGAQNKKPKDYLEEFNAYIKSRLNELPALMVVTQRPRDLTRAQLKELEQVLAQAGYTNVQLRSAWKETTNAEIAAGIIGFIRQQALGSPLLPYDQRVDRALARVLSQHEWTPGQRGWLERIANQMKQEVVVDPEALNKGAFKTKGGFNRLNKEFEGRMETVLADLQEAAWDDEVA